MKVKITVEDIKRVGNDLITGRGKLLVSTDVGINELWADLPISVTNPDASLTDLEAIAADKFRRLMSDTLSKLPDGDGGSPDR